jgi:hypothetical protein
MDPIISFILGGVVVAVIFVTAMRRACKKPEGKTAKVIAVIQGGGGPTPVVPR